MQIESILGNGERLLWSGRPNTFATFLGSGLGGITVIIIIVCIGLFTNSVSSSSTTCIGNDCLITETSSTGSYYTRYTKVNCITTSNNSNHNSTKHSNQNNSCDQRITYTGSTMPPDWQASSSNIKMLLPFILVIVVLVLVGRVFLLVKFTEYFITSQRIICKSGIIGTDWNSLYFSQMVDMRMDVGFIGKFFFGERLGTITFIPAGIVMDSSNNNRTPSNNFQNIDGVYDAYKIAQSAKIGTTPNV